MRFVALIATIMLCLTQGAFAQNLSGIWQGVTGKQQHVLEITKERSGALHGEFFNLGSEVSGETLNGNPVSSISLAGRSVSFDLDRSPGTFEGILAADGNSIAGNWTTGGKAQPLTLTRASQRDAWAIDPARHRVQFVPVGKDVQLEVLDWGGSGPPLVFLAGHGNTAHVYDSFAPQFTAKYHVYGITRRGFGMSAWPEPSDENYDADRLGDDVLAVIDALKLDRPVVVGHSLAGEELSSIGTRHPEKVAGLVYLDAVYFYAFYDPDGDTAEVDNAIVRRDLGRMEAGPSPSQMRVLVAELQTTMPRIQSRNQLLLKQIEGRPDRPPARETLRNRVSTAIYQNYRKYTNITAPVLAIMAIPHECGANCEDQNFKAGQEAIGRSVDAFTAATPSARVVRIPYANHYVWRTNEVDVTREMNAFLAEVDSHRFGR